MTNCNELIIGFYHKDFTIATIYDKLQRIDLGISKWTNINTVIKNGEAFWDPYPRPYGMALINQFCSMIELDDEKFS